MAEQPINDKTAVSYVTEEQVTEFYKECENLAWFRNATLRQKLAWISAKVLMIAMRENKED